MAFLTLLILELSECHSSRCASWGRMNGEHCLHSPFRMVVFFIIILLYLDFIFYYSIFLFIPFSSISWDQNNASSLWPSNTGNIRCIATNVAYQVAIVCCPYYHFPAQQIFMLQYVKTVSTLIPYLLRDKLKKHVARISWPSLLFYFLPWYTAATIYRDSRH